MKQSRLMSFLETGLSTLVGLAVAMAANAFILPALGFAITLQDNAIIAGFMTVVSIARGFVMRRLFEALQIRRPISPFMAAVIAERHRQIDQEGWSEEHDAEHAQGEIAKAGAAYLEAAGATGNSYAMFGVPRVWPWGREWFKPAGFRRDLVKGCALGIAEGEKFDRNRRNRAGVNQIQKGSV